MPATCTWWCGCHRRPFVGQKISVICAANACKTPCSQGLRYTATGTSDWYSAAATKLRVASFSQRRRYGSAE